MRRIRGWLVSGGCALLVGAVLQDVAPRFGPEPETERTKVFREEIVWQLEELEQTVNGNPVDVGEFDMSGGVRAWLEVLDRHVEVADGRNALLERRFDQAGGRTEVTLEAAELTESHAFELTSPLVDETVAFAWSEEDEEIEASWVDGGGRSALLEGLREDLDLRGFLPGGEAALGDAWDVDVEALADALNFGGDLSLAPEGALDLEFVEFDPSEVVVTALLGLAGHPLELDGEVSATWTDLLAEDDRRLARIEITADVAATRDATERLALLLEESGADIGRGDMELDLTWELRGGGELLWDVEAGAFASFRFEADLGCDIELAWREDFGGGEVALELEATAEGTLTTTAEAE